MVAEHRKEISVMVVEVVKLDMHRVWSKCVEKQWYTRGTNAEYDKMLNMTKEPYSLYLLESIAQDIVAHSDDDCWEGYDDAPKLNVMFELAQDCCYRFFEEV